jgi:Flp pilus assembly protein TadG
VDVVKVLKKIRKLEKGQALVEFALVLPLLIMLVCGIMDFGWLFYNVLSLQNACREGARKAVVISTSDSYKLDVEKKIRENLPETLDNDTLDVYVDYTNPDDPTEGDVVVKATAHVVFLTPVLGTVYKEENGGKQIGYKIKMKVES